VSSCAAAARNASNTSAQVPRYRRVTGSISRKFV
jgi:hypothetical protein